MYSQSYGFSSSHVNMWELDHKEELMFSILSILSFNWSPKNWCFQIVGLEKTLESPLDCEENKPVNPKGNQYWMFIGRTDAKAEAPVLWPPDTKSQFTGKELGKHLSLVLEMIEGRKRSGWQKMRWLDGITDSMDMSFFFFFFLMDMSLSKLREMVQFMGVTKSQTQLSNWSTALHKQCSI